MLLNEHFSLAWLCCILTTAFRDRTGMHLDFVVFMEIWDRIDSDYEIDAECVEWESDYPDLVCYVTRGAYKYKHGKNKCTLRLKRAYKFS
jgi:hypothetical protein